MKLFIYISLFIYSTSILSQQKTNTQQDFVVIKNCEKSTSARKCFQKEFSNLFIKNLKKRDLTDIISTSKDSTVNVLSLLHINRKGEIDLEQSHISINKLNSTSTYLYILKKIPKLKPKLDVFNIPEPFTTSIFFNLRVNFSKKNLEYIEKSNNAPKVTLNFVQKVPVYYGCNRILNNKRLLKCAKDKINSIISKKFNTTILIKYYHSGETVKVNTFFTVNRYGEIENIKTDSNVKEIEQEIKRVFKNIPNFNEPAINNFTPIKISFLLPVIFNIN